MFTTVSRPPSSLTTALTTAEASTYSGETLMLKYIRVTPRVALATSSGEVRSPTTTSAPRSRKASARASSRRTNARTGWSARRKSATTRRLTLPTPPPAPVIKNMRIATSAGVEEFPAAMGSLSHRPHRRGDQVAVFQGCRAEFVHLGVVGIGHHVDERLRRRIFGDQDDVPTWPLAVADHHRRRRPGVVDGRAHPLQVRDDRLRVPHIVFAPVVHLERQQVDHDYRGVGRPRSQCRELFGGGFEVAHEHLTSLGRGMH